jgi:hypothetical protein
MKQTTSTPKPFQTIGLMLLLLTVSAPVQEMDLSNPGSFAPDVFQQTPFLHYAASFLSDMQSYGPDRSAAYLKKKEEDEEDEEDAVTESSATQGKTDTDDLLSEVPHDIADVLPGILPYLNLTALGATRRVSHAWKRASESALTYQPSMNAFFLPWAPSTDSPPIASFLKGLRPYEMTNVLRRTLQWQCGSCGFWNPTGKTHCANSNCCQPHARAGDSSDEEVQRLFVGQLRKEDTSQLLWWIVSMVYPDLEIVHIESHTNPSQGGRGKGCAWLYVRTVHEALQITALHRRIYVDVDEYGREGVWLCGPSEDDKDLLTYYSAQQGMLPHRPMVLPRNPLVVEVPSKSGRGAGRTGAKQTVTTSPPPPPPPAQQSQQRMMHNYLRPPPAMPRASHHYGCQCTHCSAMSQQRQEPYYTAYCPYPCCQPSNGHPLPENPNASSAPYYGGNHQTAYYSYGY